MSNESGYNTERFGECAIATYELLSQAILFHHAFVQGAPKDVQSALAQSTCDGFGRFIALHGGTSIKVEREQSPPGTPFMDADGA